MNVFTQLLNSEKAVLAIVILIAATVLTALGHLSVAEWRETCVYIFGIYAGAKAIQGAASSIAGRPAAPAPTTIQAQGDVLTRDERDVVQPTVTM